ncbi:uncharacterized protein J3R85_013745 [Psidium guajava]|nr:uncharacterized protein J3R85_013745 [Psidium guajava]
MTCPPSRFGTDSLFSPKNPPSPAGQAPATAMGRKLKESSTESESSVLEGANGHDLKPEKMKRDKKKKKKKDKHGDRDVDSDLQSTEELNRSSQKRKEHCGNGAEAEVITKKMKKKKKKQQQQQHEREAASEVIESGGSGADSVANGKDEEVRSGNVVVSGRNVKDPKYSPVELFADAKLPEQVLECCRGFTKPSPIQSRAWPFLLDGRDFIGIAATGSGKTLAFGVPAVMHVLGKRKGKMSKGRRPLCLVLSPTRELAQQISDVLVGAGKASGGEISMCVWRDLQEPQRASMKSGVDIVIGTPGRLKDLIEEGVCSLNEVDLWSLMKQIECLTWVLNQNSPNVMFSATWPLPVHQLAQEFMDPNPIKVVIGSEDLAANHDVMQIIEVLDDRSRDERLVTLLQKYHSSKSNRVLVFVLYKNEASRVERCFKRGWNAVSIHGDKKHMNAQWRCLCLRREPRITFIELEGTGRAGNKGIAHTFFNEREQGLAGELVNVLREAGQVVPASLLKFGTHVKKRNQSFMGPTSEKLLQMLQKLRKSHLTTLMMSTELLITVVALSGEDNRRQSHLLRDFFTSKFAILMSGCTSCMWTAFFRRKSILTS